MFPPPVVFPATREVMEGYKTVSILHILQRCTHTLCSQPLCMKLLITWIKTYSIFDYCPHLQPTKLISTHITTILYFIFETQSILISPLTNISAARPQLQPCVLQSSAAGSLQSQVSVNTRLWPLIGWYLDTGFWLVTGNDGLKTTFDLLRIVVCTLLSGTKRWKRFFRKWEAIIFLDPLTFDKLLN